MPEAREQRDVAESPAEQYEQLLDQSIAVHREHEEVGKKYLAKALNGEEWFAEERRLAPVINELMRQRVALVRQIGKLRTIDDAYPLAHAPTTEEELEAIYADLSAAREARSWEAILAAQQRYDDAQWSNAKERGFQQAVRALIHESGYELDDAWGGGFFMKKDGLVFKVRIYDTFPGDQGIAGRGRIVHLEVARDKGSHGRFLLRYMGRGYAPTGWEDSCTDPAALREIDRMVAIFN